jgi:Mg-chelatase subunit ChlD
MKEVMTTGIAILLFMLFPQAGQAIAASDIQKDIVLVLDNSGSMRKNDPKFLMRRVVSDFLEGLPNDSQVGIVVFDEKANLAIPLSPLGTEATRQKILGSLSLVNYSGKWTDSPAGVERAIYELKTKVRENAAKVIIFLTDGIVDTGDKTRDLERAKWLREDLAAESKRAGIRIFGIAFTEEADYQLIQALGQKTDGGYFRALKADEIERMFKEIDAAIRKPPEPPIAAEPAGSPKESKKVEEIEKTLEKIDATIKKMPEQQAVAPPIVIEKESKTWLIALVGIVVLGIVAVVFGMTRKRSLGSPAGSANLPEARFYDIRSISGKHEYLIESEVFSIGRSATNDVVIDKSTVSTKHATIEYRDNVFYLVDQRSTNGTFLNGEQVKSEVRLRHGDRIKFDEFEFTFILAELADETKTELRGGAGMGKRIEAKPGSPADDGDEEEPTKLKDMCPYHPAWRATELCPVCKTGFCNSCMVEKAGRKICRGCAGEMGLTE